MVTRAAGVEMLRSGGCGQSRKIWITTDGDGRGLSHVKAAEAPVEAVFDTLLQIGADHGERLQLIVAANDVPQTAADRVVLRLSEDDRLIPIAATENRE